MSATETMRVGYVLKRYPRYSETFIVNEIRAHEAAGLEIIIFSVRPPNDTHFQDTISKVKAPVIYLPHEGPKAASFWSALQAGGEALPGLWDALRLASAEEVGDVYQAVLLAQEVAARGITHLHAHFASVATTVARLASHFSGVPYTFTAHAKDIFHESVRPDDLRRKLSDARAVVTVSDYNVRYLRDNFGPTATRIHRVYNGLHLEKFAYSPPADRPPVILGIGRLVEKKGFGDLIDACSLLVEQGCRFQCRIIGVGELEEDLRAQVERLGLQDRVELAGPRPQREVKEQIQSASVFAVPCVVAGDRNRDGLPTVLLEAMALGTPCVSTDVTGIPEVLRDGETGLMVPQRDPASLAAACKRLLADGELRVRLAAGARRLIEQEFDIRRNAVCLRELFRSSPMTQSTNGVLPGLPQSAFQEGLV